MRCKPLQPCRGGADRPSDRPWPASFAYWRATPLLVDSAKVTGGDAIMRLEGSTENNQHIAFCFAEILTMAQEEKWGDAQNKQTNTATRCVGNEFNSTMGARERNEPFVGLFWPRPHLWKVSDGGQRRARDQ